MVSDRAEFDRAIKAKRYLAVFADEDFITGTTQDVLLSTQTPILISSTLDNPALPKGLNYRKVKSLLSQDAVKSLLQSLE